MYIVQLRSKNKQTGKMYNSSCLLDSKECLFEPYHKGKLIYVHVHIHMRFVEFQNRNIIIIQ